MNNITAKASNIDTFLRLRPRGVETNSFSSDGTTSDYLEYSQEEHELNDRGKTKRSTIELAVPPDANPGIVHTNSSGFIRYEFGHIFGEDTNQEEVFNSVCKQKVHSLLEGVNGTVFAYGQTGSGKTYSIFGGDSFAERGIIPRALGLIFNQIQQLDGPPTTPVRGSAGGQGGQGQEQGQGQALLPPTPPKAKSRVQISFTEVYGESVYDLLDPNKRFISMEQWTPVQVLESPEEGLVMRGLNVFEVASEEDSLSLFFMGNTNR
jgi:kinesin family protein 6/9